MLAHKSLASGRVGGARVHAGALLLEEGLTSHEQDFVELAAQGVHVIGEIGISGVQDPDTAEQVTRWIRLPA